MPEVLDKQTEAQDKQKQQIDWRQKLVEEVGALPEASLRDIYYLVHGYRLGVQTEKARDLQHSKEITLSLAGAWSDWDDEDFNNFLDEIYSRRSQASRRERYEEVLD